MTKDIRERIESLKQLEEFERSRHYELLHL